MRNGYHLSQIVMHWFIALLLPIQYLTGGSIERTHHAVHMGMQPASSDILQHTIHNYAGLLIGAAMVLRLLLRVLQPPSPRKRLKGQHLAAALLHGSMYVAIIFQAALGVVASYVTFAVAPLHVIGSNVILAVVGLHFVAAAWHTLVRRDATLDRMMLPRSDQPRTWTVKNAKTT
ncbi:cytochrome b/b6 domain-containing protein [Rhizobium sp. BG4]|uniref:cytochrome b n=1 Tax=Rhizobium sp. BG4 TaxID=2613770 RepID=UPI00193C96FC|nr:cytochrome b/b6 domain-containing protein [Rhizobium sp. BG4]QRM45121.1 hypothetical protein F2982_17765 [Rhizobium sp. BG4]